MAKYILNQWQKPYFDSKLKITKIYVDDTIGVLQGDYLKIVFYSLNLWELFYMISKLVYTSKQG